MYSYELISEYYRRVPYPSLLAAATMSDDSSSDDIPLSALGRAAKDDSDEEEFVDKGDSEEDFIPEDDGDDDEDEKYASDDSDDVPLSSLRSPPKKAASSSSSKAKPPAAKKATSKKDVPKKKSTKTKSPKPSAKKKSTAAAKTTKKVSKTVSSSSSSSNYLCASSELYSQCDKGKLIQALLARWWYAYKWPDPKTLPTATPKGYDALDGFPGVYICTQGSNVGKFSDKRNHDMAPSFNNFARKTSDELKDMLLRAIDGQTRDLIKHEGGGTETEKELKVLEKWVMKLNCPKADKDAEKVLKAKRLTLP